MSNRRRRNGFSLIEVVLVIIVFGIGLAGILALFNQLTRSSADPLVRKQALAIASALMDEIQLKPFTYCDPNDSNVYTATGTIDCATAEVVPPPNEQVESRTSAPYFDNVNDYNGFSMSAGSMATASGTLIGGLADYSVSATVAPSALGGVGATESLLITVTAVHVPSTTTVVLQGYRMRYAPNSP